MGMRVNGALDGHGFRDMFTAGAAWLEKLTPQINALNVYPIPDADCGTNMLLTIRSALAQAQDSTRISSVAKSMAHGALMGARGNSGVILSQMYRGLESALIDKETANPAELAQALRTAADTARHSLTHPIDGTILTVADDAAAAACWYSTLSDASIISVVQAAVEAARNSVIKTPDLLPVLKESGVVDAGGHGLYTLLEGVLHYLKGDTDHLAPQLVKGAFAERAENAIGTAGKSISTNPSIEKTYGFCTQFLITGENLKQIEMRKVLQQYGNSLIVVGNAQTMRVHIHTRRPDEVTALCTSFGDITDIDIRDMDEQHQDFVLMQQVKASQEDLSVVAVVNGDGMVNILSKLGVGALVPGGQSMNPSIADLLKAVEAVPSTNVVILPNNKNIILTSRQLPPLTQKHLEIIPTETIPQGIAALAAMAPDKNFTDNVIKMNKAAKTVGTLEITRSVRNTMVNGIEIREGQYIGLLDGKLGAAGGRLEDVIQNLFGKFNISNTINVKVYFGTATHEAIANSLGVWLQRTYPGLKITVINGGQDIYEYIIAVE
jgi:uncharacterized protein